MLEQENFQKSIFGPQITQVPDYTLYQKPSQESQASARSIESPRIYSNRYFVSKSKPQKLTRIINIPSTSNKLEQQMKPQMDDSEIFIRLVRKNRLVQKFKANLLQKSYVLSAALKDKILNQEKYLQQQDLRIFQKQGQSRFQSMVLLPENMMLYCWDFLSLLANMLSFWICPLLLSFSLDSYSFPKIIIGLLIHLIFDNLITTHRAVVSQGEVIIDRKLILRHYIQHHAIPEFLSLLLWILIYPNLFSEQQYLRQTLLVAQNVFSILKLAQIYGKLIENTYIKHSLSNTVDLLTLILSIYFFAHLMACLFHYIGIMSEGNSQTWLIERNIRDESVWIRYNSSFYWAAMTITTVGYGDIVPQNNSEIIFVNLMMFLSSFLFAYSMNSIGIILRNIYEKNKNYKKSIIQFNHYMKQNEVDSSLQIRIRNYLKHKQMLNNNENQSLVNILIQDLPRSLKLELHYNIAEKIIQSFNLFTHQFSKTTQQALIEKLKILKFSPQEFVYHQSEIDDQSIYQIKEGIVDIVEEKSEKILQTLKKGESFGEYQFFTGFPTKTCAICRIQSEVVKVNRDQFLKIIKDQKRDMERFAHIKDNILFNQNYTTIYLSCNICHRSSHLNIDCPLMTYQPELETIIKKSAIAKSEQNRAKKISRNGDKINTLQMLSTIQNSVESFQSEFSLNSELNCEYHSPDIQYRNNYRKKSLRKRQQYASIPNNTISEQDILFNPTSEKIMQASLLHGEDADNKMQKLPSSPLKFFSIKQVDEQSEDSSNSNMMLKEFSKKLQFHNLNNGDIVKTYQDYMTQNNLTNIIRINDYFSSTKSIKHNKLYKEIERYTFNFYAKQKSLHLKQQFQKDKIRQQ